jgi:hypothetical protein
MVRRAGPATMTGLPEVAAGEGSRRAWRARLAFAVLLMTGALFALRFRDHATDDAYISFRYARNLVEGQGLVYNPGERVEGYTNFLWVMIAAVPLALGFDPLPAARVVGLLAHVAIIACVARAASRLASRAAPARAVTLLVVLSPSLAVWATAGLETPLFAALMTWGVWLAAEGVEEGRLPLTAAVLLGAAALTRPEGVFVGLVVAAATAPARLRPEIARRRWALFVAALASIVVPYWAWRTAYYGALLPNTFHAKVGVGGAQALRGLIYAKDFLLECGSWTLVGIACGIALARSRPAARVVSAVVLSYAAYVVGVGGDSMPMYRFFAPILGLLAILMAAGAGVFLGRRPGDGERPPGGGGRRAAILAAVVAAWAVLCAWPGFLGRSFDFVQQDRREVEAWRQIGAWFKAHAEPGESIAVVPAGAIPYGSGLVAIDMLGLTDRAIGRHPVAEMGKAPAGHERSDPAEVLSRRPTYIVLGVYELAPQRPPPDATLPLYYRAERELASSPEFQARYRPLAGRCPGGYFTFFARDDKVFPEVWPRPGDGGTQPSGQ